MRWIWISLSAFLGLLGLLAYNYLAIFVVQPLGAVPQGATVVVWRKANMNFIDSADAICDRRMGGVSLLCRAATMGAVMKENDILIRAGYSDWLYGVSTGGKRWDR